MKLMEPGVLSHGDSGVPWWEVSLYEIFRGIAVGSLSEHGAWGTGETNRVSNADPIMPS